MDAIMSWNGINQKQQEQFLAQAGIDRLPPPAEVTEAQWGILATVAGEGAAREVRNGVTVSLAAPQLPIPQYEGDWSAIMTKIAELQAELGNIQVKASSEDISAQKLKMQRENEHQMDKIKESIKKMDEASKTSFWGKLFGWVGAIVGLIAAVVATVATGGAAAPVLALAVAGLAMMILQETGAMDDIVEFLAEKVLVPILEALGLDKVIADSWNIDVKDFAKMAVQLIMALAMLVASVACMFLTAGASAAGTLANVMKVVGIIGQAVGTASSAGGSIANIVAAVTTYQNELEKAGMAEDRAWLAKLQQMLQEETERLQEIMEQLNRGVVDVSKMLADFADTNRKIVANTGA